MPEDAHSDGKVKIRPRVQQKAAEVDDVDLEVEPEPEPATRIEALLKRRLKQSGTKFPARNISSPSTDHDLPAGEPIASRPEDVSASKGERATGDEAGVPNAASANQEPQPELAGPLDPSPALVRKRKTGKRTRWAGASRVSQLLILTVAPTLAALMFGVMAGNWYGNREAVARVTRERVNVRPEFDGVLDRALAKLREGDSTAAVKLLGELESANPDVGSVSYLHALALMQNGDTELAEKKADESIAKGERISDSLALKAVMATQRASDGNIKLMGDPKVRSEQFLRQAMIADTANPFPMIELATLMRYRGNSDEALALLKGARSRLNPVDSHTVVDVSLMLMKLQQLPDADLPRDLTATGDLASGFGAAYVAMRTGDFAKAAAILTTCRERTTPDLFDYLVNDPAFRRYVSEPALAKFYQ